MSTSKPCDRAEKTLCNDKLPECDGDRGEGGPQKTQRFCGRHMYMPNYYHDSSREDGNFPVCSVLRVRDVLGKSYIHRCLLGIVSFHITYGSSLIVFRSASNPWVMTCGHVFFSLLCCGLAKRWEENQKTRSLNSIPFLSILKCFFTFENSSFWCHIKMCAQIEPKCSKLCE